MAHAYARLGTSREPEATRVRAAMMDHPEYVGGQGRLCTELMQAFPKEVLAKVGAEGIYCASLPERGLGIALKVESGDGRAARVALLEVLRQLAPDASWEPLGHHARIPILNTRDEPVGEFRPTGELFFE
jgi:L-asparaginase II